jgi:hypothetical protein
VRLGEDEPNRRLFNYGGLRGYASGCYDSTHLTDMVDYRFDLCEKCLDELFKTFTIPVDTREVGPWKD